MPRKYRAGTLVSPACFPLLDGGFLARERVPDPALEVHRQPGLGVVALADANHRASAVLGAGVIEGEVPVPGPPHGYCPLDVLVGLGKPAFDLIWAAVGWDSIGGWVGVGGGVNGNTAVTKSGVAVELAGLAMQPEQMTATKIVTKK